MSDRYPGGLITKTPVVPAGPYQDSAAPGIWTLEQQAYYRAQGLWPIAGNVEDDPYFKNVTLLIPGNGSNNATNDTFIDSTGNNTVSTGAPSQPITTQGTVSPYGPYWSNWFLGSGGERQYFNAASQYEFTGDFTIECWFNMSYSQQDVTNVPAVMSMIAGGSTGEWRLTVTTGSARVINFVVNNGGWQQVIPATAWSWADGVWNHVAISRSGSTVKAFGNGVLLATATFSGTVGRTDTQMTIGGNPFDISYITGYISNARMTNTAVYTAAFTPSTSPLTAISGTALLTCQSNRFKDNSAYNATANISGSVRTSPTSPFNPSSAYGSTYGGAVNFINNGLGSGYLITGANNSLLPGSGAFAIDCYVYAAQRGGYLFSTFTSSPGGGDRGILLQYGSSNVKYWTKYDNGSDYPSTTSGSPYAYQWVHLVYIRDGSGNKQCYINGVSAGTANDGAINVNYTDNNKVGMNTTYVNGPGNSGFIGFISDLRYWVGSTGPYTYGASTCTVPTSPVSTSSAIYMQAGRNAKITDVTNINTLLTYNGPKISTAQSKFGGSSIRFDQYTAAMQCGNQDRQINTLGSGQFTVEYWIRFNSFGGGDTIHIDYRPASTNGQYLTMYTDSTGFVAVYINSGAQIVSDSTLSTNTWYFIAVTRDSSNVIRLFINGTAQSTTYTNSAYLGANTGVAYDRPMVGGDAYSYNTNKTIDGYMQDIRVTKGVARYTTNFSVPTKAFITF